MKNRIRKRSTVLPLFAFLSGILLILLGLVFILSAQPALASPSAQGYPVNTPTNSGYPVATATATATLSGAATATVTRTPTQSGSLPPPSVTGTPTVLFPVTGADLTRPSSPGGVGVWIALWLLGLLLIGFGLRSKLGKQG
jgi:hypothetical protein